MSNTIKYYNDNAQTYFEDTVNVDVSTYYERFEKYLNKKDKILDLGCGSGRDSKHFIELGYNVTSIDGSIEMCKLAEKYTGQKVINKKFNELDYKDEFNAIWACASLLHVDRSEIDDIVHKIHESLKANGIIYASFKRGDNERNVNGRYFNDLNEENIKNLFSDFLIEEIWFNDDLRKDRDDKWINIIARKKANV